MRHGRRFVVCARATVADADTFLHAYFEKAVWPKARPTPLSWEQSPPDSGEQIRSVRRQLDLRQAQFAARVGSAGKVVVYPWEARKRCPSPVLWQKIEALQRALPGRLARAGTGTASITRRPSPLQRLTAYNRIRILV